MPELGMEHVPCLAVLAFLCFATVIVSQLRKAAKRRPIKCGVCGSRLPRNEMYQVEYNTGQTMWICPSCFGDEPKAPNLMDLLKGGVEIRIG